MLELEGFLAVGAFEFSQHSAFIMADHVPLQSINVGKCLATHLTRLQNKNDNNSTRKTSQAGNKAKSEVRFETPCNVFLFKASENSCPEIN